MKNLTVLIVLLFSFYGVEANDPTFPTVMQQDNRVEINPRELPERARQDIIRKFMGAEIIKAYRVTDDNMTMEYIVELEKGPKKWTVFYDDEGNPTNKINPQKI